MQVPHLLRKRHVTKRPWGLKPLLREASLSYLIHVNYFSFSFMFDLRPDKGHLLLRSLPSREKKRHPCVRALGWAVYSPPGLQR